MDKKQQLRTALLNILAKKTLRIDLKQVAWDFNLSKEEITSLFAELLSQSN